MTERVRGGFLVSMLQRPNKVLDIFPDEILL